MERLEKSTPPTINPIIGVKILFTKLVTIDENAPPTITPTAKSKTFPLAINFLNSTKKRQINLSFLVNYL